MTEDEFDALLWREESDSLDFKRDQYPFSGATETQKSELIKDILAFSNSWRDSDAYILIGVEEVKGGRSNVVGVSHHIDDAHLQQLVDAKTQRPMTFSYSACTFGGFAIGVIQIPEQERPIYVEKTFGKLIANEVYLRRGSSNGVASPDEIAAMGRAAAPATTLVAVPRSRLEKFLSRLGPAAPVETRPSQREPNEYRVKSLPAGELVVEHTDSGELITIPDSAVVHVHRRTEGRGLIHLSQPIEAFE